MTMPEEKKIIIDEDWKSQVQAEKEAIAEEGAKQPGAADPQQQQLPPASFEMLVTSLATEVMISLGQLPQLGSEKVETNLDQARYAIDMLDVLQDKTKGNLTPDESKLLDNLLHELRLGFVAAGGPPTAPPSP